MRRAALLILFLALTPTHVNADDAPKAISLHVSPQLAVTTIERAHIEIRIPRHPANRGWCLVVDGPVSFQSCAELDGEDSPALQVRDFMKLTTGHYDVRAELYRDAGNRPFATAKAFIQVGVTDESLLEP